MNVLSLFDGMSCGRIALERAGIKVANYYASEVDKHAIKVSKHNYPNIIHIGDVTKVSYKGGVLYTEAGEFNIGKIDLLLGGSPCQGFSLAGKQVAFDDPRSKLYFEYERILQEILLVNPQAKFILENVRMKQDSKDVITQRLGVQPTAINSNLVSAQNRYRLYWSNLTFEQPKDKGILLRDVLLTDVDDKYRIKAGRLKWLGKFGDIKEAGGYVAFNPEKGKCLTVRGEPSWGTTYLIAHPVREVGRRVDSDGVRCDEDKTVSITRFLEVGDSEKGNCLTSVLKDSYIMQWPHGTNKGGYRGLDGKTPSMIISSWERNNILVRSGVVRKLTPVECERLQTVPDNYTECVPDSQRYKMLGNGWTVDVIAHILKSL